MKTRILFVSTMLAVAASLSAQTQARVVEPFKLNQVTLQPSQFKSAMDRTCSYQLFLNTDRMLYSFRENYGLSTKGATPAGGLETNQVRGFTVGHMLSALSQAYASTGDNRYKLKADTFVTELAICQNAAASKGFSAGYLSGFPESQVDKVLRQECMWAPFWAIHKILQGMIDCYNLTGNTKALDIATKMGDWTYNKLRNTTQAQREAMWTYFCANTGEYGGYNESMVNLYDITKNPNHLATAKFFDHQMVFGPALRNKDSLDGIHANTQIPKFVGALRIFEATGEVNYYTTAKNFFSIVTSAHTYIDGANSVAEWWKPPNQIASQLTDKTGESCNEYNMLKIARLLFFHDPQEKYMAYFERTLYNHVLGSQDPRSAHGYVSYFIPLRSGGIKTYDSLDYGEFLCCDGTGQESHTKYGETIYAHAGDTLYVNLFIPSQLNWTEKNVTVKMDTRYPDNDTVKLTLSGTGAANLPIRFRVPSWLRRSMEVWADGRLQAVFNDTGTYAKFLPAWNAGGTITVVLPQSLRYEFTPDDKNVGGALYGIQILAGCYGTNNLSSTPTLNASTISKTKADTLNFNATPSTGATTLIPFSRMHGQRYSVYWKLTNVPRDTFIQSAQVKAAHGGIGEVENRRFQPPRVSISSGNILFAFSTKFTGDRPVRIMVFNAKGAVVASKQAVTLRGERIVRVCPDKGALVPGVYMYSVQAGKENIRSKIIVADAF
jgi:DUF1680 family protein